MNICRCSTQLLCLNPKRWSVSSVFSTLFSIRECVVVGFTTTDRSVIFSRYSGSSTNKADDIAEIVLQVVSKSHNPNPYHSPFMMIFYHVKVISILCPINVFGTFALLYVQCFVELSTIYHRPRLCTRRVQCIK